MELDEKIIWRFIDRKPGHDSQSLGLTNELGRIRPCQCYDLNVSNQKISLPDLVARKFPLGKHLPDPDIITGAGHSTHLPMLVAQRARGGKTVVIMKPSLPTRWFTYCLIPAHDTPPKASNILTTCGTINFIIPSSNHQLMQGLIMIGGPSRHYYWDHENLMKQIRHILKKMSDMKWIIADSVRTPNITCTALSALRIDNLIYQEHRATKPNWVAKQLALAAKTWVSEDSVSMIYEAITSGTTVGVLDIPRRKSKLLKGLKNIHRKNMLTTYAEWQDGNPLRGGVLHEAKRCAEHLYNIGIV